jgi:hypothetical protein
VTGVLELLGFLGDPDFVRRRFERYGDVFETVLAGQPQIFVKGAEAAGEMLAQSEALEGWWPSTVRQLLGELSLSSRNGEAHLAKSAPAPGEVSPHSGQRLYCSPFTAITPWQPGGRPAAICMGRRGPWERCSPPRGSADIAIGPGLWGPPAVEEVAEPAPTPGGRGMAIAGAIAQMNTVREAMTSSETWW